MDLLRFVVLIILFRKAKGDDFIISDNALTWKEASKQCELAEPELIFSSNGVTVNTPVDTDVWVGYYQTRTAFEYFGCTEVKNSDKESYLTKKDPGQCMSACGVQKIIGISTNKCFCFDKDSIEKNTQTMLSTCNKDCNPKDGIVCGGKAGSSTFLSLYRSIGTDISSTGKNGKDLDCMFYGGRELNWHKCSEEYATMCSLGNTSWVKYKTHKEHVFGNWAATTTNCFTDKKRPSTYNNSMSLHTNYSWPQLWTGVVRRPVFYKYSVKPSHADHANLYGYLHTNKDGVVQLKFKGDDENKKSLCVSGSSDVGAIVGATLSIVVVIVVIIGVVLFIRKRGIKLPFFHKEKQTQNSNNVQNNIGYVITRPVEILQSTYHNNQDEYAEIDLTTTIDNEPNNGASNDATESCDYAHDYFVLEKVKEETYDSTKPEHWSSDPNTFNPYNKLSFEKSSNYDHIGAGAGNAVSKVADSENAYNTTSLGDSYARTSPVVLNNAYNMTEGPEDTYNHTNIPMR